MSYKRFTVALVIALMSAIGHSQQTAMPPPSQNKPLEHRVATMERAERAEWQRPDEVVKALELKNGEVVADIGAGTGYFTRKLAQAVAPDGKVYAVDIASDVLKYLKDRADKENIHNIVPIISREDDPMLLVGTVDLAFFCDVTHHIANRANFYRKLAPGLKKHGRMAIIDYPPDSPHKPHKSEEQVPRSQVVREAEEAGFKYVKDFQLLPYQYFLVFEKK